LEDLDLSNNNLTHLGRLQFIEQERLMLLNLSNNFLVSLRSKDTFKGLLSLQNLDLSKNILTSLRTNTFHGLHSLIELHLTSNKISSIENGAFDGLNRLRVLHLEQNLLESINASWLQQLNSLRFLYISNNRLKQLSDGTFRPLTALRVLSLHDNRIHSIDDLAFEGPIGRSVDTIDLSYNLLPVVPSSAFYYLSKMASLDLSGNPIKDLTSSSFSQMHVIEKLQLNNMYQLRKIEGNTFVNNGKLSQVYLEHNLELIPLPYGVFDANPLLKTLSIRNNTRWKTLSPHQIPLRSIRQLFVSGISFNCNCSITWLWDMYQNRNETGIQIDEARCKKYTKRTTQATTQSTHLNTNNNDEDVLSKMHPEQLTCSDLSPQTLVVIIAVSVLITVCLFLIVAVIVVFRYKQHKSRSGSGYGSPCLHIKDDTMVFRGTLKYDTKLNSTQIITNPSVLNEEMMIQMPSPPSYHSPSNNVSSLDVNGKKLSPTYHVQNMMVENNKMIDENNEPVYEMPKYTELPTSSEGSDPKSSVSGSSKYSSSGYVGSELWDPEYFVNIGNVPGTTTAHCYTNQALSNSRTLTTSGNVHVSPLNSTGTSSGIGSGSGSGSSTVSNQQTQQFKPVFFSPQPRHMGNGYNMVATLNTPSHMTCDRSYYHHSLYQNGDTMDMYPSNTTRIMPFSSPQVLSKYSNGTFLRNPLRNIDDRDANSLMSSPPPPAPYDSTLNQPSAAFVMFNKPPRTKRKNQKSRANNKHSSSLLKKSKYTSDTEAKVNLQTSRGNSNKTINGGMNIANQQDIEALRANSYL
jgi:Leucine-rich repeat (LRR) protein